MAGRKATIILLVATIISQIDHEAAKEICTDGGILQLMRTTVSYKQHGYMAERQDDDLEREIDKFEAARKKYELLAKQFTANVSNAPYIKDASDNLIVNLPIMHGLGRFTPVLAKVKPNEKNARSKCYTLGATLPEPKTQDDLHVLDVWMEAFGLDQTLVAIEAKEDYAVTPDNTIVFAYIGGLTKAQFEGKAIAYKKAGGFEADERSDEVCIICIRAYGNYRSHNALRGEMTRKARNSVTALEKVKDWIQNYRSMFPPQTDKLVTGAIKSIVLKSPYLKKLNALLQQVNAPKFWKLITAADAETMDRIIEAGAKVVSNFKITDNKMLAKVYNQENSTMNNYLIQPYKDEEKVLVKPQSTTYEQYRVFQKHRNDGIFKYDFVLSYEGKRFATNQDVLKNCNGRECLIRLPKDADFSCAEKLTQRKPLQGCTTNTYLPNILMTETMCYDGTQKIYLFLGKESIVEYVCGANTDYSAATQPGSYYFAPCLIKIDGNVVYQVDGHTQANVASDMNGIKTQANGHITYTDNSPNDEEANLLDYISTAASLLAMIMSISVAIICAFIFKKRFSSDNSRDQPQVIQNIELRDMTEGAIGPLLPQVGATSNPGTARRLRPTLVYAIILILALTFECSEAKSYDGEVTKDTNDTKEWTTWQYIGYTLLGIWLTLGGIALIGCIIGIILDCCKVYMNWPIIIARVTMTEYRDTTNDTTDDVQVDGYEMNEIHNPGPTQFEEAMAALQKQDDRCFPFP